MGCLDRKSDKPDPRNFKFRSIKTAEVIPATFMDMYYKLLEVSGTNNDCQFYGDCTSYGGEIPKRYQEEKVLSRHFLYNAIKKISGRYDTEGDYLINAMKALCKMGVCEEAYFPTVPAVSWLKYVMQEPSEDAKANALIHKGRTYWELDRNDFEEFKRAMSVFKTPLNFAMEWNVSYYNCPASGHLPLPTGEWVGGHSLAVVGFDGVGIWGKNSHGKSWGKNGYFFIPYEDWTKHSIATAFVLLDLNKNMIYKMNPVTGEQYLLEDGLMIGFNIGDNIELDILKSRGLNEQPSAISEAELKNYKLYPLVNKDRLGDLFGI